MLAMEVRLAIARPAAPLDGLDQLFLGLGHVAGPVGRKILAKRFDSPGMEFYWRDRIVMEPHIGDRMDVLASE